MGESQNTVFELKKSNAKYHIVPITQNKLKDRQDGDESQHRGFHGGRRAEMVEKGHRENSGMLEVFHILIGVELPRCLQT